MSSTFLPLILIVVAALTNALMMVFTEYLEDVGGKWYQAWVAEYWICFILIVWYWILSFAFNYFYYNEKIIDHENTTNATNNIYNANTNYSYHSLDNNSNSNSNSNTNTNSNVNDSKYTSIKHIANHNSFLEYLVSVFPPTDRKHGIHWTVLTIRSASAVGCFAFSNIALVYLDSGDTILIQIVLVTLLNLFFGIVFFNEKLNKIIIGAVVLCIIGLILVTRPTFIFGGSDYSTISTIGFIMVVISALLRGLSTGLLKYTHNGIDLSHDTVIIVSQFIMTFIVSVVYIFGVYVSSKQQWYSNVFIVYDNDNDNGTINDTEKQQFWSFLFVSLGILFFIWILTAVIGFRLGNIGRLGIIQNIEVIFTYLLDAVLLSESQNYLCYIGVVLTLAGCAIVFYEQHQNAIEETTLGDNDSDDSYAVFE